MRKFSYKTLLFKTVHQFMNWFNHIVKRFHDISVIKTSNTIGGIIFKVKYSIS